MQKTENVQIKVEILCLSYVTQQHYAMTNHCQRAKRISSALKNPELIIYHLKENISFSLHFNLTNFSGFPKEYEFSHTQV